MHLRTWASAFILKKFIVSKELIKVRNFESYFLIIDKEIYAVLIATLHKPTFKTHLLKWSYRIRMMRWHQVVFSNKKIPIQEEF